MQVKAESVDRRLRLRLYGELDHHAARQLMKSIADELEYALPLYVKEGKSQLMIAIGCTGGKHRSITFARKIGEYCTKLGYQPSVQHRDARRTA